MAGGLRAVRYKLQRWGFHRQVLGSEGLSSKALQSFAWAFWMWLHATFSCLVTCSLALVLLDICPCPFLLVIVIIYSFLTKYQASSLSVYILAPILNIVSRRLTLKPLASNWGRANPRCVASGSSDLKRKFYWNYRALQAVQPTSVTPATPLKC